MLTVNKEAPLRLDDLYRMVAYIYSEKNTGRPVSATFSHFVEVCGALAVHDRKKKREELTVEDALCKALGWYFPLLAKLKVVSVEELVFRKFPYACPYCRSCPHDDRICKTVRGTGKTVDHDAVVKKYDENLAKKPRTLAEWQKMFNEIYPRTFTEVSSGRSSIGLLEELGELAEAVRVFEKHPKYFAGEAADIFSYIMGIANEHSLKVEAEQGGKFDFDSEFLLRYPGLCTQCGHQVCVCPNVPESTVGRLSKELEIADLGRLFGESDSDREMAGKAAAELVVQGMGGYSIVASQLPFDRGEVNRALILLCMQLAAELEKSDPGRAASLRQAAIKVTADIRPAGASGHSDSPSDAVRQLQEIWPLVSLGAAGSSDTLEGKLALRLQGGACRFGVVTALPLEFAAMKEMFEESDTREIDGDPNMYVIGVIPALTGGRHLVVLTMLNEIGNNTAASAATNLIRSFQNVEEVLMVGIAGGIPSPESPSEHVRLGDVVVCDRDGVVQYDNLKIGEKTTVRSAASKPSARMIQAAKHLEAKRLKGEAPWEGYIPRAEALEGAKRPEDSTDHLFQWESGAAKEIQHPIDPQRRSGQPRIHYGKIGAANILLKDPIIRDQLKETKVRAVEMEGSGIADGTWQHSKDYMVIRGISDYCDGKKCDYWQPYAASSAAAYARALIESVPVKQREPVEMPQDRG